MDPLHGEAHSPSGCLKEVHEIEWVNDPDDDTPLISNCKSAEMNVFLFSPWLGKSTPPQQRSTQTTLSVLGGVLMQGLNLAENGAVGDPTNSISIRPTHVCKLPAKFKDGLTVSAGPPGQTKWRIVLTDDEDEVGPWKKKNRARILGKNNPRAGNDNSTDKGPNQSRTCVFSQGPEETQDTHANTEVSNNLGGLDDMSIRGFEMTEGGGDSDDDKDKDKDEWDFPKLEKMAAKDTKVSNMLYC